MARHKRAEAAQTINAAINKIDDQSAFDAFAQVEDKVGKLEATTEAEAEVATLTGKKNLDEEFKKLATGNVDDELKALKASLGLAVPPAETPPPALPGNKEGSGPQ